MKALIKKVCLLTLTFSLNVVGQQQTEIEFLVTQSARLPYLQGKFGQISIAVDGVSESDNRNVAVIKMDDLNGENPRINYVEVYFYGSSCASEPKTIIRYGPQFAGGYVLPQSFSTLDQSCIKINYYHTEGSSKGKIVDTFFIKLKFTND